GNCLVCLALVTSERGMVQEIVPTPVRLDSCSAGRRRREAQLLRGGAAAWRAVQGAGGRRSVVSAQREGTRRSGRNRGNEELSSVFSCRLVSPGGRSVRRGRPSRTDR